ncbi:MAG TPA: MFS transporter [Vicinamibacterales bacterium]|nr:MFS transporter [Vicinamibacterales bacterium]
MGTRINTAATRIAVALTHRNFRLLWMGALTSSIGTWMQKVAQAWLIVTLTKSNSAFYLGLDSFAGELPILLFTLLGGVVADRRDRRHLMLSSQMIQMTVAFILAGLVVTNVITVWMVISLSFISGCGQAFGGPAYQSLIPTLVGKDHLPNAVALNSIQFNLARVIGPVVAGAALASLGMVWCFGLNGISFLFVIAAILALRDVHVPPVAKESIVDQMKGGLRYVRDSRALIAVMVIGFIVAFLGFPILTFLPVITKDVFNRDVGFYSRLMTCAGAGAVTGALVVAYIGRNRHIGKMLLISLGLFGAAMALFSLSRTPIVSAAILFIAGSLLVMSTSLTTSLAQLLAPAELRGRVVSIYMLAFRGGSPLGGLASGWLVTQVGSAPKVLMVNGITLTIVALFFLIRGHGLKDV